MGAEERLIASGVSIEESDFWLTDQLDVCGALLVHHVNGEVLRIVAIRPGLTGEKREQFIEWAESRLLRFDEHGPEPDGWRYRTDGGWQLWDHWWEMPNP